MSGSIFKGYNNSDTPTDEYNVAFNISASQVKNILSNFLYFCF